MNIVGDGGLRGRVALVTGAGQGMGEAVARALARRGARVLVTDLVEERAERVAAEIRAAGFEAVAAHLDVRNWAEAAKVVEQALASWGRVDILVNNAGVLRPSKVEEIEEAEWELVIGASLKGTFNCSRAVLPHMRRAGWGRIINLSSTAGKTTSTLGGAHYTAAKAGVLGLTRHLAREYAPYGVTVNAICPGIIDTAMVWENCTPERLERIRRSIPMGRLGTVEEAAALVVFLALEEASYITGAAIELDGGELTL